MTTSQFPSEFESDGARYELGRLLGRGNAAAVYLAVDRETGEQVALKKLFRIDTKSVLRLKREFRSLTHLHHPNLVKLYDLGRTGDSWFLTMEYIEGPDLLTYLDPDSDRMATRNSRPAPTEDLPIARWTSTFTQLACGVHALHRAGMLHRDLKPSNVLVAPGERVVVLDFGLARELDGSDMHLTQDGTVSGTPAYMPPEQAMGHKLSEVSDWYAFGVMMYQVMSGRLPIDGRNANDLLRRKLELDPTPLRQIDKRIPAHLEALCMRLLRREPAERPSGDEVIAGLGSDELAFVPEPLTARAEITMRTETQARPLTTLFGRDAELQQLREALERAQKGQPMVMHVRGASGAGKSALVEHFLESVQNELRAVRQGDVLVLRSRCYEREAMPFKALDGVMDALVRHLSQLDDFDVAHLLPADVAELAQLFPALDRLRAVQRLLASAKPHGDAVFARQRAELALRDMFARLSARGLVVLWIDDLQWGDLDSALLLERWLSHVARAPLLVLFSYRSEELLTSSCLHALLGRSIRPGSEPAAEQTLELAPLEDSDVERLCQQRLGPHAYTHPDLIARIVAEARGNPFLASQLTALAEVKLGRRDTDLGVLSIGELVVQSSALLPLEARRILHVLAIAGRPILPQLALRAAGIDRDGSAHLHALKTLRLMRTREVAGERRLETYHDRVREGVLATLSAKEREAVSDRLLRVLEVNGQADADWLYTLSLAAGQRVPALRYGIIAAERASSTLAFERAAELYHSCIELSDPAAISGELWLKLALALSRCKRGTQAANAYLEAAKHADVQEVVPLMRLAASHLMRTGHYERGAPLLRRVLTALHIDAAESETGLLTMIAWERMRLSMMRDHYTPRAESQVEPELLEQVDVYVTLAVDTLAYDPLLAALFQARGMRFALNAGDPTSLVRAWCITASWTCITGSPRAERETERLLSRAATLCKQLGRERLMRYVHAARALCAFFLGRVSEVVVHAQEAERLYRDDAQGDAQAEYYHLFTVMAARLTALLVTGDYNRLLADVDAGLEKARATDNLSMPQHLAWVEAVADALRDRSAFAQQRLDEQRAQLPQGRLGVLHVVHMNAVMTTACATNDYAWARGVIDGMWKAYRHAAVHASAHLALYAHALHARLLLNQHVVTQASSSPGRLVRADVRVLESSPFGDAANAQALRVRARVAWLEGARDEAAAHLRDSIAGFEKAQRADEIERSRWALGRVLGNSDGSQLCAAAEHALAQRGVAQPRVDLRAHFPELFPAAEAGQTAST